MFCSFLFYSQPSGKIYIPRSVSDYWEHQIKYTQIKEGTDVIGGARVYQTDSKIMKR